MEIQNKIKYARIITLIVGIIFIAYGVVRGESDSVLSKAIRICLECIGIG